MKVTPSCLTLSSPMDYTVHGICQARILGSLFLLQGIFPTQGSNPGLSHCGWILYHLSHQGSPGILEWVAYPFSRGTSQPRNQARVSCIAGRFFTSWATREFLWNDTGPISRAFNAQVIQSGRCPFISVSCVKPKYQATLLWNLHSESLTLRSSPSYIHQNVSKTKRKKWKSDCIMAKCNCFSVLLRLLKLKHRS